MTVEKKSYIKDGESFRESRPYCPHCGEEQSELLLRSEENEHIEECERCEKAFAVTYIKVYSTRVLK